MIGPTLHALALIALVGATLAICLRWGRPEKGPRILLGTLVALVCIPAYLFFGVHRCDSGNPGTQAFLGITCTVALAVWVRRLVPAHLLMLTALAATVGLVEHYNALVHKGEVTGNPDYSLESVERDKRRFAADALVELAKSDAGTYPAGWLRDAAFVAKSPARLDLTPVFPRTHAEGLWHTWFSGLYAKRLRSVALWFPGGRLKEGAAGLEWRDLDPAK